MADQDEDALRPGAADQADVDMSDETQDFRFLSALTGSASQPILPRRGEKDFEPHGTRAQQDELSKARAAMHQALSHTRVHNPKGHIRATYDAATHLTHVASPRGQHFRTAGKADAEGRMWLLPEEALYLLERGNLDVRLAEGPGEGLPFSLQMAYAMYVGRLGLSLERYMVYAGLKRNGYIVQRGPAWEDGKAMADVVPLREAESGPGKANTIWEWLVGLRSWAEDEGPVTGPLVSKGLYRGYSSSIPWMVLSNSHAEVIR